MVSERVLIAGATGYLGGYVLAEAQGAGFRVRALARRREQLIAHVGAEIVETEATIPGALRGICEGVDVVFSSLGITRQNDRVSYEDVDYGANLKLLREAERSGVRRFVYVSVLHPERTRHTAMVGAKERFVEALRSSPIESVVVRPTGFFSDMAEFLTMAQAGRVYVLGDGNATLNPIHGQDLAAVCVDAFSGGPAELPVGGPEILSQREIAALAFAAAGKRAKVSAIPIWAAKGALALVRPFNRRMWNIGAFMVGAGGGEMVGPCYGQQRLGPWFCQQATKLPTGSVRSDAERSCGA